MFGRRQWEVKAEVEIFVGLRIYLFADGSDNLTVMKVNPIVISKFSSRNYLDGDIQKKLLLRE